ncbi:hypothetical protein [Actinomadura keratinilytica]|uniref:Uncharacterized protein n=1 Tax=Actinomadura keratinilytica TaxID=547461 RepID=A0ABP7YKJ8_9ACTN
MIAPTTDPAVALTAAGMSIFGIASALPRSAAPAAAPLILALGGGANHPLLFTFAAVTAVVAGLTVRPVKGVR